MIKVEVDLSALMYLKAEDLRPVIFKRLDRYNDCTIRDVEVLKIRLDTFISSVGFRVHVLYKWDCTEDGETFVFYSLQPYILKHYGEIVEDNISCDFDTLDKAIEKLDKVSKLEVLLNAG